jgi:nucleotide-binding universal stress UspA family protein
MAGGAGGARMNEKTNKVGERIVVGIDLSETGDHALREGMRLCQRLPGSELHVTNVIYAERGLHDAQRLAQLEQLLRTRVAELRERVTQVCRPEQDAGAFSQETVFHVRIGEPAEALHQVAVDVEADLIVVGTHARTGVGKLLLGSVAESLIQIARVPVLVARPKDFGGLPRTERPEARRPGEDLHGHGVSHRVHLEFMPRTRHIAGLV